MGDLARCGYCGDWLHRDNSVTVVVAIRHRGDRVREVVTHLHDGSCLDSWAATSRALVADLRRLVPVT